jgi:hypothetical protein
VISTRARAKLRRLDNFLSSLGDLHAREGKTAMKMQPPIPDPTAAPGPRRRAPLRGDQLGRALLRRWYITFPLCLLLGFAGAFAHPDVRWTAAYIWRNNIMRPLQKAARRQVPQREVAPFNRTNMELK